MSESIDLPKKRSKTSENDEDQVKKKLTKNGKNQDLQAKLEKLCESEDFDYEDDSDLDELEDFDEDEYQESSEEYQEEDSEDYESESESPKAKPKKKKADKFDSD